MAKAKLTAKQAKFIEEYLIDLNASAAAKRAGFSQKNSDIIGYQLLQKTTVQKALAIARQKLSAKAGVTQEMVIEGFRQIAQADLAECYNPDGTLKNIHDIPAEARQALAGVEVFEEHDGRGENRTFVGYTKKIKMWDKVKALDSLAKHLGLYDADNKRKLYLSVEEMSDEVLQNIATESGD